MKNAATQPNGITQNTTKLHQYTNLMQQANLHCLCRRHRLSREQEPACVRGANTCHHVGGDGGGEDAKFYLRECCGERPGGGVGVRKWEEVENVETEK